MESRADRARRIEVERALDAAGFEAFLDVVQLAVFEQRILGDAVLDAFRLHHVHRIVKHRAGEFGGFRGEENLCLWLALEENRQRPDVVEVRVGDDDRVRGCRVRETRNAGSPRSLRVSGASRRPARPSRFPVSSR